MDYTLRVGGEAGQGLQTIGGALAKIFSRTGYQVFTHQDYMSRIRGGHNFYQIRFSDREVSASRDMVDILLALDLNTIEIHKKSVRDDGFILYDSRTIKKKFEGPEFIDVPFKKIALEVGKSSIMVNTVAIGAVLGLLDLGLKTLTEILKSTFKKKGEEVIEKNVACAEAGYNYVISNCPRCETVKIREPEEKKLLLIDGLQAIGMGALISGCKFYSAYPMTPSTGILNYLASKAEEYGLVVEQAEDEIAAINMAIGASFAGVRAMTGSSGGGFALMGEGLSLAGITETPLVIAEVQRPGPATGLPTRTEQADLLFILYAGHGEFPRVIFEPGTPKQAFYLTNRAFELAEKYQIPVFIQSDQYLGDSEWTFENFDFEHLIYNNYRLREKDLEEVEEYKRYKYSDTGISLLAVPGESGKHLVVADSDEHDEEGHIIEDAETRIKMVRKRLQKKLPLIKKEIEAPLLYGDPSPEIVLLGHGSTYGVIKEMVDILSKDRKIAMMHFSQVYPLPERDRFDYIELLENAKLAISIENNATGQFAKLIRAETGFEFTHQILKFDGRPFTIENLKEEVDACL
ncbi:2-oxoacid:ferredoxin oxidoreductase subunit alpha [Methanosarcina sp. 1.H.T.1A.1]|uniref:2-oxoacid:acceptor oxidoreductase subunit alpha n=1 Tax=Methanosarcina sp. 1.H.T.1A.1 TaxID=1483602 RepID=UPI000621C661|nr:2-oxoacid:acceptor oxidoreductase subunit alpha [Methanosarcina sp. 1.H.T.1A.1]KKH91981.1 2-oxoacid:ferredoxin oxidoreductase subunit alpha [Methanosarcina sp. 1.H.T.1A.1]